MFSAPCRAVKKASNSGCLGDLNPTPWAVMLGNCTGWVTYSILINNLFVFFANAPGLCLSVWLNMQAIKLQYSEFRSTEMRRSIVSALEDHSRQSLIANNNDSQPHDSNKNDDKPATTPATLTDYAKIVWDVTAQNTKAPISHEIIVLIMVIGWVAVISTIAFGRSFSANTRELIVGLSVNINLVFFYGAPLSTIFTVLKTRSSSTIHVPTMITNTLNGVFWTAFGIALIDWFIMIPNGLGALLGFIQVALCVLFPRRREETREENESPDSLTTEEDVEKVLVVSNEAEEKDVLGDTMVPQDKTNSSDNGLPER